VRKKSKSALLGLSKVLHLTDEVCADQSIEKESTNKIFGQWKERKKQKKKPSLVKL